MPTDEELTEFYQGFMYRSPDPEHFEGKIRVKRDELVRLFGPESSLKGKKFLDYGGGTGIAFAAATELGMEVSFFEIDSQATAFVQQHFGLSAESTFHSADAIPEGTFDIVFSDNVIEHDPRPHEFVKRLHSYLRPGGELVIKTPHARSAEIWFYPAISLLGYTRDSVRSGTTRDAIWTLLSRRWNCDPPRHVFSFSRKSLDHLAEAAGIVDRAIEHYSPPLLEYALWKRLASPPRSVKAAIAWVVNLVLGAFELALKPLHALLRLFSERSAAGVILRTRRAAE